jgi:hypothetical protein
VVFVQIFFLRWDLGCIFVGGDTSDETQTRSITTFLADTFSLYGRGTVVGSRASPTER